MSRTVFILGAGASKEAGGPLMAEFLDAAETIGRTKDGGISNKDFDLVFRGRASLQAVHSKSNLDLDNIESVLAAFEMAALFKRPLGALSVEEVASLPSATRRLIVETLERVLAFPYKDGHVMPPPPYHDFVGLISAITEKDRGGVCLITFNYDLALDYALHFNGLRENYCLDSDTQGIPLLKLHGSVNWTRCSNQECGEITPWNLRDFFSGTNWPTYRMQSNAPARLNLTEHIEKKLTHCNTPRSKDPVIVPPTWNKTQYHHEIAAVWQNAARHLSEAENIFVIGYSLPETDQFFRYLFALGTMGDTLIKKFWVFDPEQTNKVEERYNQLLGQMSRNKFQCVRITFANAIGYLKNNSGLV